MTEKDLEIYCSEYFDAIKKSNSLKGITYMTSIKIHNLYEMAGNDDNDGDYSEKYIKALNDILFAAEQRIRELFIKRCMPPVKKDDIKKMVYEEVINEFSK